MFSRSFVVGTEKLQEARTFFSKYRFFEKHRKRFAAKIRDFFFENFAVLFQKLIEESNSWVISGLTRLRF
jgi:hypothetical protein